MFLAPGNNRNSSHTLAFFGRLACLTAFWFLVVVPCQGQTILYAEASLPASVNSNTLVDMPGLVFSLPALSPSANVALITLDVPQPYAEGTQYPGLQFAIVVDTKTVAIGGFTYPLEKPPSFGRMPTTIVVRVPLLAGKPQLVRAQWVGVRGSIGRIDSFASLSAILGKK